MRKPIACGLFLLVLILPPTGWALPSFSDTRAAHASSDFDLLDSDGKILSRVRRDFQSRRLSWSSLREISPKAIELIVSAEDRRFREHRGIDVRALAATMWQRLRHGSSRGGSTISMQLVRLLEPSAREGWIGKISQLRRARELESSWSKDEILEAYLNLVPFRGEYRGIDAAARAFFDKSSAHLMPAEAALLAALLRGPNAPLERVRARACVLSPENCQWIDKLEMKADARRLLPKTDLAPHYARRLSVASGEERAASTIDRKLQEKAVQVLRSRLLALKEKNVRDGAILVLENRTGEVKAYVGSSGDFSKSPDVDGVQSLRQAGSVLKPFLYALALDRDILRADSWLEDSPVDIVFPMGVYRPLNHDKKFHSWVSLRQALGSSLNVPAVKTLRLLGEESFWRLLKDLELGPLLSVEHYGPALALGVTDLNLWGLTRAYRILAVGGEGLLREASVKEIERILTMKENRDLGFGWRTALETGFPAAVKTGTSKDMRDNWCFGWSRDYTVGVWIGNFEGDAMWEVSGVTGAAPIWSDLLQWLHQNRGPQGLDIEPMNAPQRPPPIRFPKPKIIYPVEGLVLALDPEIPRSAQKLPLQAEPDGRKDLRWTINGRVYSPWKKSLTWPLQRGQHRLALTTQSGQTLDEVEIQVR